MRKGWLDRAGAFRVEHWPCPRPGVAVDLSLPPKGLLHTTEGSNLEGAMSVFRQHYAPHFTVGPDRRGRVHIMQHVPLGEMSSALMHIGWPPTNGAVRAQIEIVGFTKHTPWLPASSTTAALTALMSELREVAGIPLRHRDVARDARLWMRTSGWLGHIDAPGNDHVDPGSIRYGALFRMAGVHKPKPRVVRKRHRRLDPYILRFRGVIPYTERKGTS